MRSLLSRTVLLVTLDTLVAACAACERMPEPVVTAVAEPASATALPSTTTDAGPPPCDSPMACLVAAARQCEPTRASQDLELAFPDSDETHSWEYEIRGTAGEGCELRRTVTRLDVRFNELGKKRARAVGMKPEELSAQERDALRQLQYTGDDVQLCVLGRNELAEALAEERMGVMNPESWNTCVGVGMHPVLAMRQAAAARPATRVTASGVGSAPVTASVSPAASKQEAENRARELALSRFKASRLQATEPARVLGAAQAGEPCAAEPPLVSGCSSSCVANMRTLVCSDSSSRVHRCTFGTRVGLAAGVRIGCTNGSWFAQFGG